LPLYWLTKETARAAVTVLRTIVRYANKRQMQPAVAALAAGGILGQQTCFPSLCTHQPPQWLQPPCTLWGVIKLMPINKVLVLFIQRLLLMCLLNFGMRSRIKRVQVACIRFSVVGEVCHTLILPLLIALYIPRQKVDVFMVITLQLKCLKHHIALHVDIPMVCTKLHNFAQHHAQSRSQYQTFMSCSRGFMCQTSSCLICIEKKLDIFKLLLSNVHVINRYAREIMPPEDHARHLKSFESKPGLGP
jgi:hypothetical protein